MGLFGKRKTRATRRDDGSFAITGQKIFISHAHEAEWGVVEWIFRIFWGREHGDARGHDGDERQLRKHQSPNGARLEGENHG